MPTNDSYAFPRGRPQFFASAVPDLARASASYGYGRSIPYLARVGVRVAILLPGVRSALVTRQPYVLPCGVGTLAGLLDELGIPETYSTVTYQSEWAEDRFSILFYHSGKLAGFLQVRPENDDYVYPQRQMSAFRFPEVLAEAVTRGWHGRLIEPLPTLHRPYEWNGEALPEIASQASKTLLGTLTRPKDLQDHWVPIHGDLTPWNLRVDRHGRLWLIDWEYARWGPPLADLLRFAAAELSITVDEPPDIALRVAERLGDGEALTEAATYWLSHPIFASADPQASDRSPASMSRGLREAQALRLLADGI